MDSNSLDDEDTGIYNIESKI